jgi:hypothetical protein
MVITEVMTMFGHDPDMSLNALQKTHTLDTIPGDILKSVDFR